MTAPRTTYLLDTSACVRFLNGRAPGVMRRLATISDEGVVSCSVVKAALFYGAIPVLC
jgi:tRNA(fMet)-specific endonuclease VapC